MRICYILSSIPGSGKTTWAKNFKACNLNTFIVSSDEIRKELGGTYQYFKEEERVWKIFFSRSPRKGKLFPLALPPSRCCTSGVIILGREHFICFTGIFSVPNPCLSDVIMAFHPYSDNFCSLFKKQKHKSVLCCFFFFKSPWSK